MNSDWFFLADENWDTYVNLSLVKNNVSIHEIRSIHGHDAFLIEATQLARFLKPVFGSINKEDESRTKLETKIFNTQANENWSVSNSRVGI